VGAVTFIDNFVSFEQKNSVSIGLNSILLIITLTEIFFNGKETEMPEFGNPFSGLALDRKLTHGELVRSIRFMIAAEYEAVQLYQQTAESTDNALAKEVLIDIANEEKEHAGEFLRLLRELEPDEEKFYREGYEEVEEMIAKLKQ
jgi:hypothetical protein